MKIRIINIFSYLLAMLPVALCAQTQTENYIEIKTYRVGLQENQLGTNHKDSVSRSIQYFDGLGRVKQSIAVQGGGDVTHHNHLPIDWTLNHTGSTSFYNQNGSNNKIVNGSTPFGDTDLLWDCGNDISSNNQGGFTTDNFAIDHTKTYRYTIWVKKTVDANSGNTYHGPNHVVNLDGSTNTNPYFWYGKLPQADTWYLLVGVVHPHNHTGGDTGLSGVYDTSGVKVIDGLEFKWNSSASVGNFRSYLAYNSNINTRQYFWSPLVQQINGNQMPLSEVLSTSNVITLDTKNQDIVRHYSYDALGRQAKEYLPIAVGSQGGKLIIGDLAGQTNQYYKVNHSADFAGVSLPNVNAYSEKVFDNSPLNRVVEQTAPGKDWKKGSSYSSKGYSNNSHSIKFEYGTNTASEVKLFGVATTYSNHTYTPSLTGGTSNYAAKSLYKTITRDENWTVADGLNHTTEEFKNKQGQVLLKRTYNNNTAHDTYYVYDDFGNLTYVLPPKASDQTITTPVLDELCYQYKYDHRNRLVEKKIPGKGWEHIVYDKLDRPVLTQDAIQRSKTSKEWLFTKYDALGRVVYTGKYTNDSIRTAIQTKVNSLSGTTIYEDKSGQTLMNGSSVYYTHRSYPATTGVTVFTINYYDSYTDLPTGFTAPTEVYKQTITTNTKGLATVSKVRVLGTNHWITTATYYDTKARPIYVYSKNEYLQTEDIVESKLDEFTGKVLETKTTHKKTGKNDIITVDRFEYDHMDRLISQTQKINDQTSNRVVKNNYDNLGQLQSKLTGNGTKSGYTDVTSGITITYDVITKTGTAGWNEGLATLGSIQANGYVSFKVGQSGKYAAVGLSKTNTNTEQNTIDYAIYTHGGGLLQVYELGVIKGSFGTYTTDDVLSVERIGTTIYYKKNGVVFYKSAKASSGVLLGDLSLYNQGHQIKDFSIVDNSKGLQKVDYAYNVRGWLKKINSDGVNDNDLFNFNLQYNDATDSSKNLYNGNISQTSWSTASQDSSTKTYTYTYDALNRIIQGHCSAGNYHLNSVSYDKNGNILSLSRNGHVDASATNFGLMDNLQYSYNIGNQLTKVVDNGNDTYGFKDGANSGNDYAYDVNGNMLTDANKGITNNIQYNHLNLPTQVSKGLSGTISYVYDAMGTKLEKSVLVVGSVTTTTQYAGNYVYKKVLVPTQPDPGCIGCPPPTPPSFELQFFNHPEGYIKKDGNTFNYVYQYKDHLGNVRLSYADTNNDGAITASTEIVEESNYYPFGLKHKGYNNVVSSNGNSTAQKFKYQGQELEEELGKNTYAYQWRDYDPTIGKFGKIDRYAEKYYSISPYAFTANNPILYREIAGDSIGKGKEHFERLRRIAQSKKQEIQSKRARRLKNAEGNERRTARLKARFAAQDANPNSKISRLNQALLEFDALENSEMVFNFITNSPDVDRRTAEGNIQYNTSTGEINVNIAGDFNAGFFGHEAKHGFQFLEGKLSFNKNTGNGGFLYDLQDEVEAFKRQSLFGGEGRSFSEIRRTYTKIRNRTTQRTVNSPTIEGVPGVSTYGEQFLQLKGTANEQVYIKN